VSRKLRNALLALCLSLGAALPARPADEPARPLVLSVYTARISEEATWQRVLGDPFGSEYADAYLVAASLSREYARRKGGALRVEFEGNVAYHFGDQRHLELNVAPIVLRWTRFPWSHRVETSAAFGIGLSYATQRPEVEVAIESDTRRLLVFWIMELTAGKPGSPWSALLRLHHRSVAWGLMGADDGGMNAPGIGVRYRF
jgi:hypothetical protein